jgi:curved DNA-binding protein CbpA
MDAKIDPLKILNLPKDFTAQMLRDNFKKIALQAHPDKGGSEYLFNLVTQCYKYLAKELKKKEQDKQFHDLKTESQKYYQSQSSSSSQYTNKTSQRQNNHTKTRENTNEPSKESLQSHFYKGSRFDSNKFNKFFEQNKFQESDKDTGYEQWMKEQDVKEAPQYRGSFSSTNFNNHFDKNAKTQPNSKVIIKYVEPEALVATKSLGFTEIGEENTDDFSGENKSIKNLNYMDYRIAHTTSRIVDPSVVERQEFKDIKDLERSRGNISFTMNEQELLEYHKKKRQQEKLEEQRLHQLRNYDHKVQQHYERLNGLLTNAPQRR